MKPKSVFVLLALHILLDFKHAPSEPATVYHIPRLHVVNQCEHCRSIEQSTSASSCDTVCVCGAHQCRNCNDISGKSVYIDMPPSYFDTVNQPDKNHINTDSRF